SMTQDVCVPVLPVLLIPVSMNQDVCVPVLPVLIPGQCSQHEPGCVCTRPARAADPRSVQLRYEPGCCVVPGLPVLVLIPGQLQSALNQDQDVCNTVPARAADPRSAAVSMNPEIVCVYPVLPVMMIPVLLIPGQCRLSVAAALTLLRSASAPVCHEAGRVYLATVHYDVRPPSHRGGRVK
ncbi:hypothetical protein KUCAC02_024198, partial [Chaenocephalus aceratus]